MLYLLKNKFVNSTSMSVAYPDIYYIITVRINLYLFLHKLIVQAFSSIIIGQHTDQEIVLAISILVLKKFRYMA